MGAGGMGSVYEVEHIEIGRRYVLKQLLQNLGFARRPRAPDGERVEGARRPTSSEHRRRDLRGQNRRRHALLRDGAPGGRDGSRATRARGQDSRPASPHASPNKRLLGLAAAHAVGVVHRDIKPANVFLTRDGAVKVLDFGISYSDGVRKITLEGHAIGTPRYMSPEQASGEKADARSDLYAVGLLLFEMLAGEGPFDDLSEITQQMLAHLHTPPRPLSRFAEVPAGLEAIVTRALSKNPRDRARSAEYMAAELAPFVASVPGQPTPTPTAFGPDSSFEHRVATTDAASSLEPIDAVPGPSDNDHEPTVDQGHRHRRRSGCGV